MSFSAIALTVLGMATFAQTEGLRAEGFRLEGVVVNGTQNGKPLAGAEVILRAGEEGSLQMLAETVTDRDGHFVFDKLPTGPGLIFLPGVNHHGVHYPGARIRLSSGIPPPRVKLTAFDAVSSANPLVADFHEIDLQIQKGVLEITETLWVNNPSLTTYVGHAGGGTSPTTLSLLIPDGFERVTFHNEFNGRHFKLQDNQLVTDIPWTPGKREVKFTYLLPIEDGKRLLEWSVNLPCSRCRLCVRGENADRLECNLPRMAGPDPATIVFESSEPSIGADGGVTLQLGRLPTAWIVYFRWLALAVLVSLILATAGFRIVRRALPKAVPPVSSLPERAKAV